MGDDLIKTRHADLLNKLSDMQDSLIYAARKDVLRDAEQTILNLENRVNKLNDALFMIALQDSGVPGSTDKADCMASIAKIALA